MLKVDYEALDDAAKTLKAQGETFAECIQIMTDVVNGLPDIWVADTCDKYVEQYNDAEKTLQEVRQLIEDMAVQMNTISENFHTADTDMAGQM